MLSKMFRISTACTAVLGLAACAAQADEADLFKRYTRSPADPLPSRVTTTKAFLEDGKVLPAPPTCDSYAARRSVGQVVAYVRCMLSPLPGTGTVVLVDEESYDPTRTDSFSSNQLSVEFKVAVANKIWLLPRPDVRVFFSNCGHSWLWVSGCAFGSDVHGSVQMTSFESGSGRLIMDLTIHADQFHPELVNTDIARRPIRIVRTVEIGKTVTLPTRPPPS